MPAFPVRFKQWPRPWRVLAWSIAGVYAAYLLAGNLFLNTPLFDRVTNHKPQKFVMRTGPAITLLPGHVIAWNVHMRGHVNHTVYVLHAERASARLALWPLFRREVRVPRLQATGVSAEVTRVEDVVPPPPRGNQGWTLRFDAIHTDSIQHARFGKLLIIGKGSGTVGFRKQLRGGPSELYDSQVSFADASASYDGVQLLDAMKVEARFGYPWHYRDQAPGIAKFEIIHGALKVDARSHGIRVDTDARTLAVSSSPSTGQLQADITLSGGTLQPGSRAVWRVPLQAGAGAPDRGTLALQMDAAQDIRLQARLPAREDTGASLDADLRIGGREIPFREPAQLIERTSGRVQGEWTFTSLNWIPALFLRKPWLQLDGGGTVRADLQLQQGELAAGSTVDIPEAAASAEVAGVRMAGTASAHGELKPGTPTRAVLDVRVPRFNARAGGDKGDTLFDGRDLALQLSGDGRLREFRKDMRARLRFNNATIPDLTAYNRYLGKEQVRLLGGTGTLTGDVELDTDGRVGHGTATLLGSGARMRVAGLDLLGNAQVDATLRRGDFKQRYFDLSGTSVQLRNVQVGQQDRKAPWEGRVQFKQGRIDAQAPFRVDANADLTMSDAGPLLAVFAERGDYPRWVLSLLDAGQVNASTRLRWQAGHIVLDGLQAENERLSLRARLDLLDQNKRGDLYLRWGLLGAGIELDGKQRQWHLAGAREWFDGRPALLPADAGPGAAD
ncbi:hypothetical protein C1929_11230 [Stenotrophomonas sp. ZAC14D1_NAIMI4_6]|uniref:hypothetical protein n=1 Tax=Stenotrophomonas maltophilia group TaxID=995085 RepID=UPI0009A137EA|nr:MULTISPECIES: hypothetical protein [Stenotrophomonas maltophilia group]AWH37283.1 hypothetical protein C1929_11230 [Stenotrophomonas sp. ZAC14D1_NAIMI4_6]AWH41474.1 hypothetical protein C1927_11560 [Stenotrophomonas sp. ZAC14D1_NAIMI4_1]